MSGKIKFYPQSSTWLENVLANIPYMEVENGPEGEQVVDFGEVECDDDDYDYNFDDSHQDDDDTEIIVTGFSRPKITCCICHDEFEDRTHGVQLTCCAGSFNCMQCFQRWTCRNGCSLCRSQNNNHAFIIE